MHLSHVSTTTLRLVFCALITCTSSYPNPSSTVDKIPLQVLNDSVSKIIFAPLTVATSIPFLYRNIEFNFTELGDSIPKREVEKLLESADQAISDLVNEHPSSPIPSNRFEHRAPGGHVLLSIQAKIGKDIAWEQLFRLLQGLYRFMLGFGLRQIHSRVLEFEFGIAGEARIGAGVVWYFPPRADHLSKRAGKHDLLGTNNGRLLQLSNVTDLEGNSQSSENAIDYRIPDTTLTLQFHFLGKAIPESYVTGTIEGAARNMSRFLDTPYADDGIDQGVFDWHLPPSGDGSRTGMTVFSYWEKDVTWRQLSETLVGLYQFTTTGSTELQETHYQILGFRIHDRKEGLLGVGSLWHYPRGFGIVEKRANHVDQKALPSSNSTHLSKVTYKADTLILWPIRDTLVILSFSYLGETIPSTKALETLHDAQLTIIEAVRQKPHYAIKGDVFRHESADGHIVINILTNTGKQISWKELSQVLFGIIQFCANDHNQVLVFDIETAKEKVGFGTLLYFVSSKVTEKRSLDSTLLNSTLLLPNQRVGAFGQLFPIPGTPDSLTFTSLGHAIPKSEVRAALSFVLNDISSFVQAVPESQVPYNKYKYADKKGVSILISISTTQKLTWQELDEILTGLSIFMTGINPLPGMDNKPHYQTSTFTINMRRQGGYVGNGVVSYKPPNGQVTTAKRAITPADNRVLRFPSTQNSSALNHTALTTTVPYHVPHTPVVLLLTSLSEQVPADRILEMLHAGRDRIADYVSIAPNHQVLKNWFESRKIFGPRGEVAGVLIHGVVDQSLTWLDVDDALVGLIDVVSASRDKIRPGLRFEVHVTGVGEVAPGTVWYTFGRRNSISARDMPPVSSSLNNGDLRQQVAGVSDQLKATTAIQGSRHHSNMTKSPHNHTSNPDPGRDPLIFPIINSPMSLLFTNFGGANRIPRQRLDKLFKSIFKNINASVEERPSDPIAPQPWYFELEYPRTKGNLSITIQTEPLVFFSWFRLHQLLTGLEIFMNSQAAPLVFDIHMAELGLIGTGVVRYSPPSSPPNGNDNNDVPIAEETHQPSSSSPLHLPNQTTLLTLPTPFPVPSTPITLLITLNGPPVPPYYVAAALSQLLRQISSNVTSRPNEGIPSNDYHYRDNASGTELAYMGYNMAQWLTWRQLSWAVQGLLRFVGLREENCRALAAEVNVRGMGRTVRFGALVMWFVDPNGEVSEE